MVYFNLVWIWQYWFKCYLIWPATVKEEFSKVPRALKLKLFTTQTFLPQYLSVFVSANLMEHLTTGSWYHGPVQVGRLEVKQCVFPRWFRYREQKGFALRDNSWQFLKRMESARGTNWPCEWLQRRHITSSNQGIKKSCQKLKEQNKKTK